MSRDKFYRDHDGAIIVTDADGVHLFHFHDDPTAPNFHRHQLDVSEQPYWSWIDGGIDVTYSGALVGHGSLTKIQTLSKEVLEFHKASK